MRAQSRRNAFIALTGLAVSIIGIFVYESPLFQLFLDLLLDSPLEHFSYELPSEGNCTVLNIPAEWKLPLAEGESNFGSTKAAESSDTFAFRQVGKRIAFALRSSFAGDLRQTIYSIQKYSFDPQSPNQLLPVTDQEWKMGLPIGARTGIELGLPVAEWSGSGYSLYDNRLFLAGKRFKPSGDHFPDPSTAAFLSPDRQWLALQSFDGHVSKGSSDLWGGNLPSRGRFYLDVYRIASHQKSFTVKGRFSHGTPSDYQRETRWLNNQLMVIDFFERKEKFIVCDVTKNHF